MVQTDRRGQLHITAENPNVKVWQIPDRSPGSAGAAGHLIIVYVTALCQGRVVRVPSGPLVRVEGQAVSIRCNVSEYEGPRDQDFEWMMLQGQNQFQVISTFDSSYTNALFKDRVSSGDISIKKITDSSVELMIKKVRATDSATYQCSTPSTDTVFSGNYKADVALKVIGDSLKVAPSIPQPMVSEGEQLELHCNTTRAFTEHTSLSVTWSFKVGGSPMAEILTFGPDDKVTVGDSSAQRYAEGGLRLDLRGGGFYGLVLSGARPEDQGKYVCTAREWVRQGGGSLHKILEKSEDMGKVTVKPTVIGDSLKVAPSIPQPMVSEGEQLELHCNTTTAFTEHTSLSVTWSLKVGGSPMVEILTFGPDDKVTVGDSSAQRYAEGGLRLDLRGGGFYGLVLSGARPEDQGKYVCTVRLWVRQGGGSLHKILEKSEDMGNVTVKPTDTGNTDPDQEWLSYVYFCRGIVTLVFMVMLISFLSLHGCKRQDTTGPCYCGDEFHSRGYPIKSSYS
ncbi:immunoglobulin superfamily member 8-like isoform X3 [Clupea harengus]|uniref:immunoglobulin superfamily member 8-like isoform X3 n=1 Tax=Clupea harengus TaxID=7950 RepID=UPI0012AC55E5|nr:immunoglobulin superfamily member 8-like isoform X3 [Clupea harengus]